MLSFCSRGSLARAGAIHYRHESVADQKCSSGPLPSSVPPCFGWGRDGHRIVGEIATHHLPPEAKAGVLALLGDHTLIDVGSWADEVRSQSAYRWSAPLHYANVEPGNEEFNLERDCPEKGCVVSAIIKYTKVRGDRDAGTADRTEALKFLVHFVEDIHQPMHVSHARDRGSLIPRRM